jgi:uncharacterized RDD family membrane protein YckC
MTTTNLQLPTSNGAAEVRQLASLGERLLGQIIDGFIAVTPLIVVAILPWGSNFGVQQATVNIAIAVAIAYLLFSDGLEAGQSFGKRAVNTAVVDRITNEPCTFGQSFIRNLLLMVLGFIDWIFIFGEKRQRLGDKAAGTVVITTQPDPDE